MPGPVPKRDSERIRRNLPEVPTDTVVMVGPVEIPELGIPNAHPMIVDFYESLKRSGQSKYYEDSDWQLARMALYFANKLLNDEKPSSMMLQQVNSMLSDLLVAEGQRRRVRLEIERQTAQQNVVQMSDYFRDRLGGSA